METAELKYQLKEQIIKFLNLISVTPDDIKDDEPLFGEGLGLVDNLLEGILHFTLGLLGVALGFLNDTLRLHFLIVDHFADALTCLACQFVCLAGDLV